MGPGRHTAKIGLVGEIERKLAKLSKTILLTVLPLDYFMGQTHLFNV
jgi:hypothetical protein